MTLRHPAVQPVPEKMRLEKVIWKKKWFESSECNSKFSMVKVQVSFEWDIWKETCDAHRGFQIPLGRIFRVSSFRQRAPHTLLDQESQGWFPEQNLITRIETIYCDSVVQSVKCIRVHGLETIYLQTLWRSVKKRTFQNVWPEFIR